MPHALQFVLLGQVIRDMKTVLYLLTKAIASGVVCVRGHVHTAHVKWICRKVMKKCTLCVDRIYNENLEPDDQIPACVRTCPAGARHFGDFNDPESQVSKLVTERGGIDLMPEQETKPVNKYLPPRQKILWKK